MNSGDQKFYVPFRPNHNSHLSKIPSRNKDEDAFQYYTLVQKIFGHQEAVYPLEVPKRNLDMQIRSIFYRDCYAPPTLRRGIGVHGASVSTAALVQELFFNPSLSGSNKLMCLLGDVGVGKTTFVNYLISIEIPAYVKNKQAWFIRVDIEDLCRLLGRAGKLPKKNELFVELARKTERIVSRNNYLLRGDHKTAESFSHLQEVLQSYPDPALSGRDIPPSRSLNPLKAAFKDFVGKMNESARRLAVILDNIDYVCHLHDRELFRDPSTSEADILAEFCDFVEMFDVDPEFKQLGATVLFVSRSDSFEALCHLPGTSQSRVLLSEYNNAFRLERQEMAIVLESRQKLLKDFIDEAPAGRRRRFQLLTDTITEDLRATSDQILRLSTKGYRAVMEFLSAYAWLSDDQTPSLGSPLSRFAAHPAVALITFMLESNCGFDQVQCHFPNIFLVHMQPGRDKDGEKVEHQHAHSYWLKYLMCSLVEARGVLATPDDIKSVFCTPVEDGGYENNIVEECGGSLSEANGSGMFSLGRRPQPILSRRDLQPTNVVLTPRGVQCMAKTFSTFAYLQLIVEESRLPIPKLVESEFVLDPALNYSYLVSIGGEFDRESRQMIRVKARQVLLFLEILEHSLEAERHFHKSVFDQLEQVHRIKLWSATSVRSDIIRELKALERSVMGAFTDDILRQVDEIRGPLRTHIFKAYESGCEYAKQTNATRKRDSR